MSSLIPALKPTQAQIEDLARAMASMPQLQMQTNHYFANGMYARELFIPKGATIVGKVHKTQHFFILTKGALRVTTDDGIKDLRAPCVIVSHPGSRRAGHALEDSVCLNIHRTPLTDLSDLEHELVEDDDLSLFDARNALKGLP